MRTAPALAFSLDVLLLLDASGASAHRGPPIDIRFSATEASRSSSVDAYQTGKSLLALENVPEALAAFRKALVADPRSVDALNGVAVCYDRLGRPDVSRGFYEAALLIDPDDPVTLNNLGFALVITGDYAAARVPLQRAAASDQPAARASAQRTLELIASIRADVAESEPTDAATDTMVERTSEGEQRLILHASAQGSPGEQTAAGLTVVARGWSDADDRRLIAADTAAVNAKTALANVGRMEAQPPGLMREPTLVRSAQADAATSVLRWSNEEIALAISGLAPRFAQPTYTAASSPSPAMPPRQRLTARAPASVAMIAATGGARRRWVSPAAGVQQQPLPGERDVRMFDSDDDELNRFATRVRAGLSAREQTERERFAAMVRQA